MANQANSHSLSDFRRNAEGFLADLHQTKEPLLITVDGEVQAVMVDPGSYQEMEDRIEQERFIAAVKVGLKQIDEGQAIPLEVVRAEMKAKYGF